MSLSLVTLASPLLHAATSVSGAVLHGVGGAFEKLLHAGDKAPAEAPAPVDDHPTAGLQARADAILSQLETHSLSRLAEAGIALKAPLALETDALGNLQVSGEHPQSDAIERALAGDPRLDELIEELQAIRRELARERRATEADRLFSLDPNAARKLLDEGSPLDEAPLRFTLAAG